MRWLWRRAGRRRRGPGCGFALWSCMRGLRPCRRCWRRRTGRGFGSGCCMRGLWPCRRCVRARRLYGLRMAWLHWLHMVWRAWACRLIGPCSGCIWPRGCHARSGGRRVGASRFIGPCGWRGGPYGGCYWPHGGCGRGGPCDRLLWPRAGLRMGHGRCGTGCSMHAGVYDSRRHVDAMDGQRPGCGDDRGPALVDAGILLAVLHGLRAVRDLRGQRAQMLLAHRIELTLRRPHVEATPAAVVADAVVHVVDHRGVVDVGDVGGVDVVDRAVVHEAVLVPVAAVIARAGVSIAIGNAAVEAYVRAPVAGVKAIGSAREAPPAGRPQRAGVGSQHPDAGHPVIAAIASPAPVAGIPDIAGSGAGWLRIDRQLRRRLAGRNTVFITLLVAAVVGILLIALVVVGTLPVVGVGVVVSVRFVLRRGRGIARRGNVLLRGGDQWRGVLRYPRTLLPRRAGGWLCGGWLWRTLRGSGRVAWSCGWRTAYRLSCRCRCCCWRAGCRRGCDLAGHGAGAVAH